MGCTFQAKHNRGNSDLWFLKYKAIHPDTGQPFWKVEAAGTTDRKEARALLARRETEVADGKPVAQTAGRKNAYTFEVARAAIIADQKLRCTPGTARATELLIDRSLAHVFAGRKMNTITADEVARYAAARLDTARANGQLLKPATVALELRALSRMFTLGVKSTRLAWKPAMPVIRLDNAREGFLERADFEAVCKRMPAHYRDLLVLAYWTGWRMQNEELAPLEWRHVDLDAETIRLHSSKNGDGRVFPYANLPAVRAVVLRLAARRESFRDAGTITPHLFTDDAGVPLFRTFVAGPQLRVEFRQAWKDACTAAGVPGRIPHDLRRTAVRNLVAAGASEKVAMQITGHKTRAVFDRYHIVNTNDLHHALGQLAARSERRPAPAPRSRRRAA